MAGVAAIEAIGVISGILGIVQFGIDNFGGDEENSGSVVKVAVALEGADGAPPTNTGGDLPDVRVWNDNGVFVGMTADPGTVDAGNLGSVTISHDNQNTYSLFSANDDAICVAWATVQMSDDRGGTSYAVSGDFGRVCGGTWYASGMYPQSDSEYQPDCFWIDANGDQPNTGFQVRWPSYANVSFDESNTDPEQFCDDIKFGLRTESDPNSINYFTRKTKRQTPTRAGWMASQLVVSDSQTHSAQKLCDSDSSLGPDFAHTGEQKFCDMDSKTLYDFCSAGNNATGCFDLASKQLSTPMTRRGSVLPRQSSPYSTIKDWRKNQDVKI
ncbi:hypothetical protein PFICI_14348 [Pestalotiopsis fici W106-1]|uniref:Uncharacterized protein n=1 Tax=Pestalotiopsis fici (strain W106-1 / CGMCC3.15140) TaxID=1229662 RepID=W3WMU4_PESFW|nr:uncharacterized protein PFICI_14348 [Pestalotiopsis fici W106-1]ETS74482.1 hypothetical protein PFICI_14348 [Pestalotiopsis fici W106-1]